MTDLAKLVVRLEAQTAQFQTELKKSNALLASFRKSADSSLGGIKVSTAALAAGAVAASAGLVALINQTVDAVSGFKDLADQMGDTAEAVASLKTAADLSDTEFSKIAAASVKLTAGLAKLDDESKGAGAAVKALGLDFETFRRQSPTEQLEAVAFAMARFADDAGKTATAVELFGKSGAQLIPFLNDLAETGGRQVRLTQEQIDVTDEYAKEMSRLKTEMSLLASAAIAELVPGLTELAKSAREFLAEMDRSAVIGALSDSIKLLVSQLDTLAVYFGARLAFGTAVAGFAAVTGAVKGLTTATRALAVARAAAGGWVGLAALGAAAAYSLATATDDAADSTRDLRTEQERATDAERDRVAQMVALSQSINALQGQINSGESFRAGNLARDAQALDRLTQQYQALAGAQKEAAKPSLIGAIVRPGDDPKPKASQAQQITEAQRMIESLGQQLALYGDLSRAEETRIGLANGYYGVVSPQQANELMRLAQLLDALDQRTESLREAAAAEEQFRQQGQALAESLRTPTEIWEQQTQLLDQLYNGGYINAETRTRALASANDELYQSLDRLDEPLPETANQLSVFADQAARNMQSAFADYLFNPFDQGLEGMLQQFAGIMQQMIAEAAAAQIFEALGLGGSDSGGGALGGVLGAIFGGGAGAGTVPGKANGGRVRAGQPYMVGEVGRELFVPDTSGMIIANDDLGTAPSIVQNITVQAPQGTVSKATLQQVGAAAARNVARANRRGN